MPPHETNARWPGIEASLSANIWYDNSDQFWIHVVDKFLPKKAKEVLDTSLILASSLIKFWKYDFQITTCRSLMDNVLAVYTNIWLDEKYSCGPIWLLKSKSDHYKHFKHGLKGKPAWDFYDTICNTSRIQNCSPFFI